MPRPVDANCAADVMSTMEGDTLVVEGTTSCEDGARLTVFHHSGARQTVFVEDGGYVAEFEDPVARASGDHIVDVAHACHWLNGMWISS